MKKNLYYQNLKILNLYWILNVVHGITHGIYDLDTDILYFQYDFKKFKNSIEKIAKAGVSKYDILNEICESLHSKTKVDGVNRSIY